MSQFRSVGTLVVGLVLTAAPLHAFGRKASLHLDYGTPRPWSYAMNYESTCVITDADSTSEIPTRIRCRLSGGAAENGGRFNLMVDSVAVASDFYNEQQQSSIVEKLTGARLGVALIRGCPVVDTLSTFNIDLLSEWDLVLQFARLLPDMPTTAVRPGHTWERTGIHPVMTTMGRQPCEVYRRYAVDSLSRGSDTVHISWNFRYAAAHLDLAKNDVLRRVPISGTGRGTAVIDNRSGAIVRALVEFRTPVGAHGDSQVFWNERTSLDLLQQGDETTDR